MLYGEATNHCSSVRMREVNIVVSVHLYSFDMTTFDVFLDQAKQWWVQAPEKCAHVCVRHTVRSSGRLGLTTARPGGGLPQCYARA